VRQQRLAARLPPRLEFLDAVGWAGWLRVPGR
jgi:hypothetical protein